MTTQASSVPAELASAWWMRPYGVGHIIAGFLTPDEIYGLYPPANYWQAETVEQVRRLCGTTLAMSPRPDAGQAFLSSVEEPEALEVLGPVSQALAAPPGIPIGYAWVDLHNLIILSAVADPSPGEMTLAPDDAGMLAQYSLSGPLPTLISGAADHVFWSAPVLPTLKGITPGGDELVVRYQLSRILSFAGLILVGYEGGRYFLINQYGRVLHALRQGIDRLLCLVHYGLDLDAPDLGLRLPELRGSLLNHFGRARLLSGAAPLVRDFLDPGIAVAIPMREPIFATQFFAQSTALAFEIPPVLPVPLPPTPVFSPTDVEGNSHDHAG